MNLEELKRLCDEATPGPWEWEPGYSGIDAASGGTVAHIAEHTWVRTVQRTGEDFKSADARFIAAARSALPLLIAVAEAAELLCVAQTKAAWDATLDALAALETK